MNDHLTKGSRICGESEFLVICPPDLRSAPPVSHTVGSGFGNARGVWSFYHLEHVLACADPDGNLRGLDFCALIPQIFLQKIVSESVESWEGGPRLAGH